MAKREFLPNNSAYVAQYYPTQNFGSPPSLYFGQFRQNNDDYRTLLRFPLPFCPNKSIISATLDFNITRNEIPSGVVVSAALNQALQSWEQFSVTWNTQPLFGLIRTFPLTAATPLNSRISLDVTATVRSWVLGTTPNYGFVITGNETLNSLIGINNVPAPPVVDHIHHHDDEEHRFKHERDLVGVLAHALSDCCGKRYHHKKRKFEHHHRIEREHPTIFVQDPYGSLNFVRASTVIHPLQRPRLIVNFG